MRGARCAAASAAANAAEPRMFHARLRRPLAIAAVIQFLAAAGHEYHSGHQAVHVTKLQHRAVLAKPRHARKSRNMRMQVDLKGRVDEWEELQNLTTELQDRKSEYTGEIGVGTRADGGALFHPRVVFDTGSTNLWVASVLCTAPPCESGQGTHYYDPERSLTQESYDNREGDIDIMFGTGELKGPLHVDTYRVGPMVVKQQPFAMIREMTGEVFASFPFEGILGLAFPSLSFGGITPFFERVIEQRVLENNEFAFYLNVDSDQPSAILWGGVDKDLYEGPITMFPVVQMHYWSLELVEFRVGDKVIGGTRHPDSGLKRLIIDSGTTYFTVPSELFSSVVDDLPEAPCDDVSSYQPLTYVLRGVHGETFEIIVTQETYMIGTLADDRRCKPAFMSLDVNEKYGPAVILGEVFMRHFFVVFARGDGSPEQARVGFAAAKIGAMPKVKSHARERDMSLEDMGTPGLQLLASGTGDRANQGQDAEQKADASEEVRPEKQRRPARALTRSEQKSSVREHIGGDRAARHAGHLSRKTTQPRGAASFLETPRQARRYTVRHPGRPRREHQREETSPLQEQVRPRATEASALLATATAAHAPPAPAPAATDAAAGDAPEAQAPGAAAAESPVAAGLAQGAREGLSLDTIEGVSAVGQEIKEVYPESRFAQKLEELINSTGARVLTMHRGNYVQEPSAPASNLLRKDESKP